MREGSREKGSGRRGKEARCSPSPHWALGEQGPLWGAEGPPGASCAQLELGGSVRAPFGEQARAEDAPNTHAPVSFPQSASTPRHHQNPPGDAVSRLAAPGRSQKRAQEGGGRRPPHAPDWAWFERSLRLHHHPPWPSGQRATPQAGTGRRLAGLGTRTRSVWSGQCVFNEPYNVFQIMLESLILLK